ncbi:MAG: hypothetical protein AB1384_13345 [Actinomycetota bacterium]
MQRTEEADQAEQAQQAQQTQQVPLAEEGEYARDNPQAWQVPAYQPLAPGTPQGKEPRAWLKPVGVGALIMAVGLGSFFGGMAVGGDEQQKQVAVGSAGQGEQVVPDQPNGDMGQAMPGRMGAMGEVTAVSSSSISVEDVRSGEASTFEIDSSTEILDEGETAGVGDIEVGDSVMVIPGDSDESVAARIIINPAMGGPGGPGGRGAQPPGETTQPDSSDSTST